MAANTVLDRVLKVENFQRLLTKIRAALAGPAVTDELRLNIPQGVCFLRCLAEAQAGQRAVFFVDAAHFVLAPFLG